jgi:hypothetical protein
VEVPQHVQHVQVVAVEEMEVGVVVGVVVPKHVQVVVEVLQNVKVVVEAVVLRNVKVVIAVKVVVVMENNYLIYKYRRIKNQNHNKGYYLNISGDSWTLLKQDRNKEYRNNKEEKIGIFPNFFFEGQAQKKKFSHHFKLYLTSHFYPIYPSRVISIRQLICNNGFTGRGGR